MRRLTVSAVVPCRNRGGVAVANVLAALCQQADEVFVVDYGSDETDAADLCELAGQFGASLLRLEADRWCKPRAINYALRRAKGDVFAVVDADCVVPPSWGRSARAVAWHRFCTFRALNLLEPVNVRSSWADLVKRMHRERRASADGNIAVNRAWLERVRGYDEDFYGWGKEDNDMRDRAASDGLELFEARERVVHQPHWGAPRDVRARNTKLLEERRGQVVRNQGRPWGEG